MKYILDGVLKEPFSLLFVIPDNRRNDYIIQPLEKTSLMGSFLQQVYIVIFELIIFMKYYLYWFKGIQFSIRGKNRFKI